MQQLVISKMPNEIPQNYSEEYVNFSLALSPSGKVHVSSEPSIPEHLLRATADAVQLHFARGYAQGLLYLGVANLTGVLPPSCAFWQRFSRLFVAQVCRSIGCTAEVISAPDLPLPPQDELQDLLQHAPLMVGVEYLSLEVLSNLWQELIKVLNAELQHYDGNLQNYLGAHNSAWNLVGRVCFHLAENKDNHNLPFAFLATYTDKLLANSGARHLPLGNALQEYAGAKNRASLLALLLPVQKAAAQSGFINNLVESRDIFHTLLWTPREAHQFLRDIPIIEGAGVVVRVPNWWNAAKPTRPKVAISIGKTPTSALGMGALLDFDVQIALSNGESLNKTELELILNATNNLVKIKGQWVEVDREKLATVLAEWQKIQKQVKRDGLSFAEGLRMLAGMPKDTESDGELVADAAVWSMVTAGNWLQKTLNDLRNPATAEVTQLTAILSKHLQATLRPYQMVGVKWLWLLYNLKLGGCLADDMGLGKTIQILSLLLLIKHSKPQTLPHLLIVPASLLANWQGEILRFAPSLSFLVIHSSADNSKNFANCSQAALKKYDLIITTYGFAQRLSWLPSINWDVVVLDEAQTIKNPNTKQTRVVKTLQSKVRFILSGTPIENRLMDLWSLFDFAAPGLLGTSKAFLRYNKKLGEQNAAANGVENNFLVAVRSLVNPYILRRLKCDKKIIADLPDKTELKSFCVLTKAQVGLYQKAVTELKHDLQEVSKEESGIRRRGVVLSYILRFKQICNHPTQWLGHGGYEEEESGKFLRIKEICAEIAAKQEKVLIFTQFREIIPALADFLTTIFGCDGLVLHGNTAVKERAKLVDEFQRELGPPFFVLSLKAGGTGLNLTNAAHVIHFDRWWNPSVENQATDRAYRIGQKKNVLVHKFICRGTIEEKIDALIEAKKNLSNEILTGGGAEALLTEMSNEELMRVVALDINRACAE